ncbi:MULTISPECIES: hypothetical protein [unclassified Pseudoalteromonas]|uniref:hypothetical protein n=1 Tax=unclassified Pseudoalteromonas TaxID=194690 RepID=UPI0025B2AD9D|nr:MULTISPECIES: hypothetical protein [unclassified Pseudoalteromonas]MDN3378658.1 hypothetical protein [Pseudoalteromonas sp. APC 3893]MDN3387147.1 hypothetical protein [Pseudoalteromonas sp. APC 4017]
MLFNIYHNLTKPYKPLLKRSIIETFLRTLIAMLGGYIITTLWTAALAITLPMKSADAVLMATMSGFIIFTAVVVVTYKVQFLANLVLLFLSLSLLPWAILLIKGVPSFE